MRRILGGSNEGEELRKAPGLRVEEGTKGKVLSGLSKALEARKEAFTGGSLRHLDRWSNASTAERRRRCIAVGGKKESVRRDRDGASCWYRAVLRASL